MSPRTKVLHDSRLMGVVTACIVANAHRRRDGRPVELAPPGTPLATRSFWGDVDAHVGTGHDRVVLCGITFDDREPDRCRAALRRLKDDVDLEVWSHRWPDGYSSDSSLEVLVPQYHFYTTWRRYITDAELSVFGLAQLDYHDLFGGDTTDPEVASPDARAATALAVRFRTDPVAVFQALESGEAARLVAELDDVAAPELDPAVATVHSKSPVLCVELGPDAAGYEETHINLAATAHGVTDQLVVTTRAGGATTLHLSRPNGAADRPSVQWLMDTVGHDALQRAVGDRAWVGPQDSRHVVFEPGTDPALVLEARDAAVEFARSVQQRTDGRRKPPAGLGRYLHEVATSALQSLDVLGHYTGAKRTVWFDPTRMELLLDTSPRRDRRRSTLVLHLWADTLEAAMFLFGENGYNSLKLEQLLEGALNGLKLGGAAWVGSHRLPSRVRVDVHLADGVAASQLPELFTRHSTTTISRAKAFELGVIADASMIGRALTRLDVDHLVVYAESEMIGPSVPYAMIFTELCRHLARRRSTSAPPDARFEVLDLFAGSGVSCRSITSTVPNVHVLAVDAMISGSTVGVADDRQITWLRCDARSLFGPTGLIDRRFDVVGMDPPHGMLIDLVFGTRAGASLIEQVRAASDWLVMYVGHTTQVGRQRLLDQLVRQHFDEVGWLQAGQEMVLIAGPGHHGDLPFARHLDELLTAAHSFLANSGWEPRRLPPVTPESTAVSAVGGAQP